jgi:acetylornithine deacetylase/succinyl-diaminopimelate desuccinylase-like protein
VNSQADDENGRSADLRRDRRLTSSARAALYGSFTLTALTTAVLYLALAQRVHIETDPTDYSVIPAVVDLQGLVQIDTTADHGREIDAARYLAELLAQVGIDATIDEQAAGKANVWAILEGQSPDLVVLHSHLDTDPIHRPEAWREEPFGGTLRGPYIYGRGVFDMKSTTIAQLHAFLAAARRADAQGPARRSLALLATSSEETDSVLGTQHILASRPEIAERIWVVLTEGGVVEATSWDSIKHWGTSFAQKRYAPVTFRSSDRDATLALREALRNGELGHRFGKPHLNAEAQLFLSSYLETRQHPDIREPLRDLPTLLADPDLFDRQPPFIKALFRNELHAFEVREEVADDGRVSYVLPILLHLPPGATLQEAVDELLPTREETSEFERTVSPAPGTASGSPLDHPAFTAIQDQILASHGEVPRGPFFLAFYANDCRFFRAAGKACYGFSPFLLPGSDSATTAGPDERIALRGYVGGVALYEALVQRLLAL